MFDRKLTLDRVDPEVWAAIQKEDKRQEQHIELIASENYASPAVMQAQGGGSILNNGSTAAHRANSSPSLYSALKAAVCHFTRCMALELADHGIRVNTVCAAAARTAPGTGQINTPAGCFRPCSPPISTRP